MQVEFWHERWEKNQIGFHQDSINVYLENYWSRLQVAPGETVFVPLCGKSRDMIWLCAQGYRVLGIELSPIAVRDFFAENDLRPTITQQGDFQRWETDALVILQGDFFNLIPTDIAHCSAVYDRASLIALPPDMRSSYTAQFLTILPPAVPTLLITLDYDQSIASGPPFAVSEREVRDRYEPSFAVELLEQDEVLEQFPGFRKKGLTQLTEQAFLLAPRQA